MVAVGLSRQMSTSTPSLNTTPVRTQSQGDAPKLSENEFVSSTRRRSRSGFTVGDDFDVPDGTDSPNDFETSLRHIYTDSALSRASFRCASPSRQDSPHRSVHKKKRSVFSNIGAASQAFEEVGHELGQLLPDVLDNAIELLDIMKQVSSSLLVLTQDDGPYSLPSVIMTANRLLRSARETADDVAQFSTRLTRNLNVSFVTTSSALANLCVMLASLICVVTLSAVRTLLADSEIAGLRRCRPIMDLFCLTFGMFVVYQTIVVYFDILRSNRVNSRQ